MIKVRNVRIKMFYWGLLLFLGGFFFYALKLLFYPVLLGGLFALILHPAVEHVQSENIPRTASIFIVFSLFFIVLLLIFLYLLPLIVGEIQSFNSNRDYYITQANEKYHSVKSKVEKRYPKLIPWKELEKAVQNPKMLSASLLIKIPKVLSNSLELLLTFLLLPPLFTFFLLKDGYALKKWAIQFVPNRYFELVMELLYNINRQIVGFMRGQILDSTINAILLSFFLSLIGLPYAILVGVFGGMANAIPVLGPIVAGLTGMTIAILTGKTSFVLVFLVFAIVHIIDVMFIYPQTVGHNLHLHEVIVIVGVIVGGHLYGIIGMLLFVPLLGICIRSTQIMYHTLKGYRIL